MATSVMAARATLQPSGCKLRRMEENLVGREFILHQDNSNRDRRAARLLRRVLIAACVGLVVSVPVRSQATAAPAATASTPTIEQMLNHYLQATGGRAAWQKVTSRVTKGTIEVESMNLSGTVEIYEKAPDKILSVISVAGVSFRQAFDGTVGWTDDPQNGVREQSGAELSETRRDADFYHPLDLKKLYAKLSVTRADKIGDQDVYVMEGATSDGDPDEIYFDAVSGLPVRIISHRHSANGLIDSQEDFGDFRDVDGIKLPFTIRQKTNEMTLKVQVNDMQHNVAIDDSRFSKPAAQ
jgi:zinc protease